MYWPQPLESHHDFAALRETILSNQFPADPAACNRTLLFYDNSVGGGLGYTAKMMGYALLIAVQERRVLILLPGNPSYDAKAYGHDHAHSTTRWCTRPPHSLACYYEPPTHCAPDGLRAPFRTPPLPTWHGQPLKVPWWSPSDAESLADKQHVVVSMESLHLTASVGGNAFAWPTWFEPKLWSVVFSVLFQPRPWLRELAFCYLRQAGLCDGTDEYTVVHARFSASKQGEDRGGASFGYNGMPSKLPGLEEQLSSAVRLRESVPSAASADANPIIAAAKGGGGGGSSSATRPAPKGARGSLQASGGLARALSRVLLQTANDEALFRFRSAFASRGWRLDFTENLRADHDLWLPHTFLDTITKLQHLEGPKGGHWSDHHNFTGDQLSIVPQAVNS